MEYTGEVYQFEGTRLIRRAGGRVPIALSGSSPQARAALMRFGDSYLLFAAPPDEVAAEIERLRSTPAFRPSVTVGLRAHIIVRPTEAQAWDAADNLISRVDPRVREHLAAQVSQNPSQRAAQQRLAGADELVVAPNLWAGVGTGRYGVATAIVGNPEQVVDRLVEYTKLGVDFFILSGYPKLDEVHRFGALVTPLLRDRGLLGQ